MLTLNNLTFSKDEEKLTRKVNELLEWDGCFKVRLASSIVIRITVDKAPIWHAGQIVGYATGDYPAAEIRYAPETEKPTTVVLLTDGRLSMIAEWNVRTRKRIH